MDDTEKVQIRGRFEKTDDERQIAFGWAYVVEKDGEPVVDHSGDFVDKQALPDLEDAVYGFVHDSREADEMHVRDHGIGKLVESVMLTPEKFDAMGIKSDRVGWWTGFRVEDDSVWEKVKDGTYPGFSIRGVGTRESVDAET